MKISWKPARRIAAWPAVALTVAACLPALAAEVSPPGAQHGLLVLPNVKILTATPAQRQMAAPVSASVGRAFKDRDTGQLRAPTPEELIEIGSQPELPATPAVILTLPNGTRAAQLGDEALSHSIVHRDAAGKLERQCVAGSAAMSRALTTGITQEAHRHDHQ